MSRSWFVLPILAVTLAACSSGAAGAVVSSPASATPAASLAAPSPSPAPTPSPSPIAMGTGDPWLLFSRTAEASAAKTGRVILPDGTGDHRILADVEGDIRALTWAPDGERIAFVVRDGATPDGSIWTAAADGTGATMLYDGLADGCSSVFYPSWSPDGTKMALVCYKGDDSGLAVLDLASRRLTPLVDLAWPDALDNPMRWSHDGTTIAFDILHWDPTNAFLDGSLIATVAADGSAKPRHLTAMSSFAVYPDWSADDDRLVYNTYDLGNMQAADLSRVQADAVSNLFTMAADGSDVRQLTTASAGATQRIGQPRWDPSGGRIWVTVKDGDTVVHLGWVDPATGHVTMLDVLGSRPQPRPQP